MAATTSAAASAGAAVATEMKVEAAERVETKRVEKSIVKVKESVGVFRLECFELNASNEKALLKYLSGRHTKN